MICKLNLSDHSNLPSKLNDIQTAIMISFIHLENKLKALLQVVVFHFMVYELYSHSQAGLLFEKHHYIVNIMRSWVMFC